MRTTVRGYKVLVNHKEKEPDDFCGKTTPIDLELSNEHTQWEFGEEVLIHIGDADYLIGCADLFAAITGFHTDILANVERRSLQRRRIVPGYEPVGFGYNPL